MFRFNYSFPVLAAGLLLCLPAAANQRASGWCEVGGTTLTLSNGSGYQGVPKIQASVPGCTVTVYLTGTTTLATIYADNKNTPLGNPFSATSTGGYWFFYAANGRYDVTYTTLNSSFTTGDVLLNDPNSSVVLNTAYNYPPLIPMTSLTAGSQASVTVACPQGVSGTDQLYLSGGTGTAEVVYLQGGTCSSGASSGTLLFTPVNTHSGAWTITSATAGIQEALTAMGGTNGSVFLPTGTYTYCGTVYMGVRTHIYGAGVNSVLKPCTANQVMIDSAGSSFNTIQSIEIDHFMIDASGFQNGSGLNTVIGIYCLNFAYAKIHDMWFDNTNWATYYDRASYIQTINIHLFDNAGMFAGSTLDPGGSATPYAYHDQFAHITQAPTGPITYSLPKLIQFSRCNNCTISQVNAPYLQGQVGISLENDCQGVDIFETRLVYAYAAIQSLRTTVGTTTIAPRWTGIHHNELDQFSNIGIYLGPGTSYATVDHNLVTNSLYVTVAHAAIYSDAGTDDILIDGNVVQGLYNPTSGQANGIVLSGVTNARVVNNFVDDQITGGSEILVNGTGNSHISIQGNTKATTSTTAAYIYYSGTIPNLIVTGNEGEDDVIGATLASAATIALTNPVHAVSGTTAITTITAPMGYTGPVTLIPTGVWTLATGGNIAAASTAVLNKALILTPNSTTGLWYASY